MLLVVLLVILAFSVVALVVVSQTTVFSTIFLIIPATFLVVFVLNNYVPVLVPMRTEEFNFSQWVR
jgi:hypothetical protein